MFEQLAWLRWELGQELSYPKSLQLGKMKTDAEHGGRICRIQEVQNGLPVLSFFLLEFSSNRQPLVFLLKRGTQHSVHGECYYPHSNCVSGVGAGVLCAFETFSRLSILANILSVKKLYHPGHNVFFLF